MTDPIGVTGVLVTAHKEGKLGNVGEESWTAKKVGNLTNSPLEAFAVVASFFAGQQSQTMADTLVRYKDKHKEYKDTLELSEAAHVLKSEAAAADGKGDSPPTADKAFRDGMDKVLTGTGKKFSDIVEKKDKKYEVGEDQV
ncbi:MAG: hypothetical protein HUK40_14120 [Desulfobacter sp.]|nr:hypothetical protein [Desulfobacter sp.]